MSLLYFYTRSGTLYIQSRYFINIHVLNWYLFSSKVKLELISLIDYKNLSAGQICLYILRCRLSRMVLYFYKFCCSNCSRILALLRASSFHIDPKRIRVQIFTNPFSSFCCENIAVIGYTVWFCHISKCQPQMTLSTGNYYDVIFLPKWRTQIWGKIDLGVHRFEWEAIPKDTDLHGKRTQILRVQ